MQDEAADPEAHELRQQLKLQLMKEMERLEKRLAVLQGV